MAVSGWEGALYMFARLPRWARAGDRRTVRLSRRQGYLIALAGLLAAVCLLGACAVSATGGGANAEASVRPLTSQAQSATTRLANAAATALAAATATTEPTATARPTNTPRAT